MPYDKRIADFTLSTRASASICASLPSRSTFERLIASKNFTYYFNVPLV